MASGMLADKRKAAGLDSNFFLHKCCRIYAISNLIGRTKDDQCKSGKFDLKSYWSEAANAYIDLIKKNFRNIERALISEGPYETAQTLLIIK